ncbi:GMC family oxidoreductase [Falsiroseomonas selenitidurans]|uniref:Choline dehydrogenase n=1 Tax=Falsiroseomonas selenitidurans TaxID=2716335 RepID=A0ABX1E1L5_9PROT|nr:FAD-dependent oxidoreductase [Falsiroseomonas selenitidurans]NKC31039.1 choline dehydrogenase [Falsiroseomonas selenitidurans]
MSDAAFDFVIIGAGSAGCLLADRLSAGGASVAVVEAGGPDRHPWLHIPAGYARILGHKALTWGFATAPDPATGRRALDYPRGRVLGGSSSINGLGHVWGDPSDYDLWAQKGCTGWSWADLAPHFAAYERAEEDGPHRGRDGALHVQHLAELPPVVARMRDAAAAIGLPTPRDMNGPARDGFSTFQQTRNGRRRHSAASAFLRPALKRGVALFDNALALSIEMAEGRATGVRLRRGGAGQVVAARREVILAAGAIGSPHLLMLSGLGPAQHLQDHGIAVRRDIPGIGANLQDHYIARLTYRLSEHRWSANRRIAWPRLALEVARWVTRGDGVLTWSPGMVGVFAKTEPGLEAPDIQLNGGPVSWAEGRIGVPEEAPGLTLGVWQCRPQSRGSVTLAGPDPARPPVIAPRFLTAAADRAAIARGIRLARRWMAAPPLQGIVVGEVRPGPAVQAEAELVRFAAETGGTVYHPCGTVRMGGADGGAPLDATLRLRGVAGLRVVDASVFPDIPVCNINATVLAVAHKAAGLILAA